MDADQVARLAYLGLLGIAVAGWAFAAARNSVSRSLQALAVWAFLFLGLIAAWGLWQDIRQTVMPTQAVLSDGTIRVPRDRDGHYRLTLEVNGVPVRFIIDTGATDMVLSRADAARAGLKPETLDFLFEAQTANGVVRTAPVRLDSVSVGPITDRGVRAVVNGGEMDSSLLGMGYLHLFDRIEIASGELILTR